MIIQYRTAKQAFTLIKEADPDTALTERLIRSLFHSGKIPTVKQGNKVLVNMKDLYEYLSNPGKEDDF